MPQLKFVDVHAGRLFERVPAPQAMQPGRGWWLGLIEERDVDHLRPYMPDRRSDVRDAGADRLFALWLSSTKGVLCAVGLMETGFGRTSIMAKGMNKRRNEKKPKKETPKVIAAAPSTKNVVAATVSKAKGR